MSEDIKTWKDMPKSKALVTLNWEDIYYYAKDSMGKTLTRDQVIGIFDSMDSGDWDCENYTFWSYVETCIDNYLDAENDN